MSETEYTADDLHKLGRRWLDRIRAAEKREDKWIKDAEEAEAAFLADNSDTESELPWFNILHSNVETIVPSIYNSTPKPDIRARHNNKDDAAKQVSDALERAISTQVDDDRMDPEVERVAQDAFMAGRGILRIKFDADEIPAQIAEMEVPDETGEIVVQDVEVSPARIENERVIYENVSWRDYREGPGKRWSDIEWVCFRHEVSEIERERLENPDLVSLQKIERETAEEDEDQTIWEIWCRETGKVYFVVEESAAVLEIMDDPLGLDGFFPMPEPVQAITGTGKRVPVCPYAIYKQLAGELNTATRRINAIMKGLKVRGLAAVATEAIQDLSNAGDNELVTSGNTEALVAMGGLDKAVMWWPVETSINVLRELYSQRELCKQSIYEITGISDIVRGASASGETATAQQIKTQWGSLRVKKMQRMIERCVRDTFILTADVIAGQFSDRQIMQAAGMQIDPQAMQLLRSPLRHYRIDVESDSTIRADLTKSRQEMSEFLQGTGAFFQTMAPIIEQAPQAAGPIVEMYASFSRQFNLGKSAEDALDQFAEMAKQASQQPKPNPEAEAAKAEMDMKMQEMNLKVQEMQAKFALEGQKLQADIENKQADTILKGLDRQLKEQELGLKADELDLTEAQAEFNAITTIEELEIEREQKRAVKIGAA